MCAQLVRQYHSDDLAHGWNKRATAPSQFNIQKGLPPIKPPIQHEPA